MTTEPPSRTDRNARDLAWVAQLRQDDEAAFEALYRAYYRPLLAIVLPVVHSGAVAEELVEDIFVDLWEQRHAVRIAQTVSAYLYTTARNRALNVLRRERVERRWRESAAIHAVEKEAEPLVAEQVVDGPRIRDAVRRAIDALPPQRRLVLQLRWEHGMSYADIAQVVGSSVVAVERQLSRTLKALRMALPAWLGPEDSV